jgi:formylglycine-generating enzyme required for sulfatase activity
MNFELKKEVPKVARLHVEAIPENAQVRILNIKPKFSPGMELEAGSYQLEVSAEGYETQIRWIELKPGHEKPFKFELTKKSQEPTKSRTEVPAPVVEAEPAVAAKESKPSPAKKITNSIGMEFILIPAGSFIMGSNIGYKDAKPSHEVEISQSFYLQTTEVTQGQWKKVMGDNPSKFKQCGDDCPVERVSWEYAQGFIAKLNQLEKTKAYRLPSEAEWEYACRAGTTTEYSFGDDASKLGEYGWYRDNSNKRTQKVATKKPNSWGLYDMHGNVWDWVEDDWHGSYEGAPADGRAFVDNSSGSYHVVRGGGWYSVAEGCRSATRINISPDLRRGDVGFRVFRSVALVP